MVCNRYIIVVMKELENMKLQPLHGSMGEVELKNPITEKQELQLYIHQYNLY